MDFITAYNNKEKLELNRHNPKFKCPRCKKYYDVKDAKIWLETTDSKLVGSESRGNFSSRTYQIIKHNIRYCPNCDRKKTINEYLVIAYYLIPCIIFNIYLCTHYYNTPELLGLPESFWYPMAERENGLLLGYIVGCGIAGATCLAIFYKIFTLFLKDDRPTLQEAIDGNSLAPK